MSMPLNDGSSFKIGNYILGAKLGSGGFGVVRKATNELNGEVVAIKVLDKTELRLHEMTQNVKKEITLLTMLQHPNIVKGLEVLSSKKKILLVMEYVDGGDIHTALSKRKRFLEDEARKLFHALIDCLAYCHERGVYHRDLKLENLLLTSSGDLKVCDFGLASVRSMGASKSKLCKTIVGTEDFSPPEILRNMPYKGDKADMWSAAIVLYVLLAGHCPFQGRSPRELAQKVIACKYSFPRGFPEGPRRIIHHLLVSDATRRPSAAEILKYEWLLNESPRTIFSNGLVTKMSSTSPWDSAAERAMSGGLASTASSSESSLRVLQRGSTRQISLSFVRKRSKPLDDDNGHVMYNALARSNIPNFFDLFRAMKDPDSGLVVQDRKWRLRTFPTCFIGSEAVSWISERQSCSRGEAVKVGQQLLNAGAFHHVVREHDFEDRYLFYRWHCDDPANEWVANLRASYPRSVVSRAAHVVAYDLLNEFLALCKLHQNLHDFREIDTVQMQRDTLFQKFLISAGELQHATLPQGSDEGKLSFLVNMHNLLWLQTRVHVGEFDKIDYETLDQTARNFQYAVHGVRISLEDVYQVILSGIDLTSNEADVGSRRPRGSSSVRQPVSLIRLFGKPNSIETNLGLRDILRPSNVDPLVLFLLSNGSPDAPQVQAVLETVFTENDLIMVAARYLNESLSLDIESLVVKYPPVVERFRHATRMSGETELITFLSEICEDVPIGKDLRVLLDRSRELNLSATAMSIEQTERLRLIFAPRVGHPLCSSKKYETVPNPPEV